MEILDKQNGDKVTYKFVTILMTEFDSKSN